MRPHGWDHPGVLPAPLADPCESCPRQPLAPDTTKPSRPSIRTASTCGGPRSRVCENKVRVRSHDHRSISRKRTLRIDACHRSVVRDGKVQRRSLAMPAGLPLPPRSVERARPRQALVTVEPGGRAGDRSRPRGVELLTVGALLSENPPKTAGRPRTGSRQTRVRRPWRRLSRSGAEIERDGSRENAPAPATSPYLLRTGTTAKPAGGSLAASVRGVAAGYGDLLQGSQREMVLAVLYGLVATVSWRSLPTAAHGTAAHSPAGQSGRGA